MLSNNSNIEARGYGNIVDIKQKIVTVYNFEESNICEYDFNRKIPVAIFNGELQIDFSKFN